MAKYNYHRVTQICVISAALLGAISIILIIASLAWQGLVVYIPKHETNPGEVECVFQVPRREGFFYMCHTMTAVNDDVNKPGIPCLALDYAVEGRPVESNDRNYDEIIGLRRNSVIMTVGSLVLAIVGLGMLCFLSRTWLRATERSEFRRFDRMLVGLSFLLAGYFGQMALEVLHVLYVRDKVLTTNKLGLIYTAWYQELQNVEISYSHSYRMLSAATYMLELAGIIVMLSGHTAFMLWDSTDSTEQSMHGVLGYEPTLPRYATDTYSMEDTLGRPQFPEDYYVDDTLVR